jgi:2-(1,2-epoxy-1,2-dihydrophenyl)acetyl-CoA isomerase
MAGEIAITDADGVRLLELNRPDALNALTDPMRRAIEEAVRDFDADDRLKALVLTGRGRGFCSGADLSTNEAVGRTTRRQAKQPRFWWHLPFDETEKPTICAVNGAAAGGGIGLALSCDIVFAAESARFHPAFLRIALVPDNGISQTLVRRMGYARALLFLLRDEPLDAEAALRFGLVDEVHPGATLLEAAMAVARAAAEGPSVSVELTKRLLKQAATLDRGTALMAEEVAINLARATEDNAEGVRAFRERRAPQFRGR